MFSRHEIFQRYAVERRARPMEAFRVECFPDLVRYTALHPNMEGLIAFANLPLEKANGMVEDQIDS